MLDLRLGEPERRLAAALTGAWQDLLYVPGPGFYPPLEPGCYRSTFLVVPADGRPVRLRRGVLPHPPGVITLEPLAPGPAALPGGEPPR